MEISFSRRPCHVILTIFTLGLLVLILSKSIPRVTCMVDSKTLDWTKSSPLFAKLDTNYELVHVQITFRHGDRSAVSKSIPNVMYPLRNVNICDLQRLENVQIPDDDGMSEESPSLNIVTMKGTSSQCSEGQLTAKGCRQHMALGQQILHKYGGYYSESTRYERIQLTELYSSNFNRTIQSLACFLRGLRMFDGAGNVKVEVSGHPLHPNPACKQYADRYKVIVAANEFQNRWKSHGDPLAHDVASQLGITYSEVIYYMTKEGRIGPSWSGIFDQMHVRISHNLGLPGNITQDTYSRVRKEASVQSGIIYRDAVMLRIATMSLLQMFYDEMERAFNAYLSDAIVARARKPALRVYSGHDSTLIPLLCALGIYDDEWPEYGSHIEFQLVTKDGKPFVRVYYQNTFNDKMVRLIVLPGCVDKTGVCTLIEFRKIAYSGTPIRECDPI
eukprot:CFRG6237T1